MNKLTGILSILLLLTFQLYAQSGTKLIGFDASTLGRGGVSIGFFDSPDLMMTNPAGISFLKKLDFLHKVEWEQILL
jgi:hypothetical protein